MDEQDEIKNPEQDGAVADVAAQATDLETPAQAEGEVSSTPNGETEAAEGAETAPSEQNTDTPPQSEPEPQKAEAQSKAEAQPSNAQSDRTDEKPEQNKKPDSDIKKEDKGAADQSGAKDKKFEDKKKGADKKKSADKKKQDAKLKKEWEDSIVANKRVKREEIRRKIKHATVILLVFSLIVTSIVYVMLLFMQENNVRITASSKTQDTSISLSIDNNMWTPYLNADGPDSIWDLSYNPVYHREKLDTVDEVKDMLSATDIQVGTMNGEKFIRFMFMAKNTGKYDANLSYEMTLDYDRRGLQNAVRVMWGETFKSSDPNGESSVSVDVYAARSSNKRLEGTGANYNVTEEDGFIEYVAYPWGSDQNDFSLLDYEASFTSPSIYNSAVRDGYFATTPFLSDNYVFQRHAELPQGDIMYCYVCIWVEGSDFDCVDDALGGYVKLGINFIAY